MIERLTTQAAARRLGVSPATVRRRIRTGELQAEREDRPQGARWWVLLDASVHAPTDLLARVTSTQRGADALAVALETIADLRHHLDESERGQSELRQLLAREQDRTRALEAASASIAQSSAQGTRHERNQDASAVSAAPSGARRQRPLWERLLGALREAIATPPG